MIFSLHIHNRLITKNCYIKTGVILIPYIEDIQMFRRIWLLFHREKLKIFIFHEWKHTYLHLTSETNDIYKKKFFL